MRPSKREKIPGARMFSPHRMVNPSDEPHDVSRGIINDELQRLRMQYELLRGFAVYVASLRGRTDVDALEEIFDAADRALRGDSSVEKADTDG
jgi:hypothetical protein